MNELDLFTAALACETAEARQALLDQHCQTNPQLRQRLEELLSAYRQADQVLPELPVIDPNITKAFADKSISALIGTMIACKYKLLEEIGEGGMGTVFVAEQSDPVKRKVAVKLIKPGMDSKSVLARFEAERQALAMMDHPNIAKVLDAGLTDERRPYFVMEYIKGLPLTKYCDDAKLSIDARLHLFMQICQAVQHAHQKGIIHRDLKPGNILIALYDGKPVPKIIDFGLAKALNQSLTDRTLHTGHEMVLGTPLYMSPEQAELNNLDIDTRSDIYSLGVILYELLTGVTPLEKQRFKEAAWAEVLRIIKEEEPTKPSTKLSHSASLPSVAAQRQMEPKRLSTLMRGDLDWIVMKALEKDRTRRYETANGFAADVQRYLANEPVSAGPPGASYRLRKFAVRNKGKVLAAGLVMLALLVGITGTTFGLARAEQRRREADERRQEAEQARFEEAVQRRAAEKAVAAEKVALKQTALRLKQIEKGNDILFAIFEDLDIGNEVKKSDEPVEAILAKRLVKAAQQLDGEAVGDRAEVAWLQMKLGSSLVSLGHGKEALPFLKKACETYTELLGRNHLETLAARNLLALGYMAVGQFDKALPIFEEIYAIAKATKNIQQEKTLQFMGNLAECYLEAGQPDKAGPLLEETLLQEKQVYGEQGKETLSAMHNLSRFYFSAGKIRESLSLGEETLRLTRETLGADHPHTLSVMSQVAICYQMTGELARSIALLEEVLRLTRNRMGNEHPQTLNAINNMAVAYQEAGRLTDTVKLLEQVLQVKYKKLGREHPETIRGSSNLAAAYWALGQLERSIPLFEEALRLQVKAVGRSHPNTLDTITNLGVNYYEAGRLPEAIALFEEGYRASKTYPVLRWICPNLYKAYTKVGNKEKAAALLREVTIEVQKQIRNHEPMQHPDLMSFGVMLLQGGVYPEADILLRQCLAQREKIMPDHHKTFLTMSMLGGALLGQKKYADSEILLLQGYTGMKQREKSFRPQEQYLLPESLDRLIQFYTETNKPDEVKKWQAEKEKLPMPEPAKK